ncbi:MAG: MBL fold metallo-hydrolase, partial [Bacteroidota bacterium]
MSDIHVIDLNFLNEPAAIAAFAIKDAAGVTLVECGPFSAHDTLIAGLKEVGISPTEVHTLLLSHIHFDHAGAAWW